MIHDGRLKLKHQVMFGDFSPAFFNLDPAYIEVEWRKRCALWRFAEWDCSQGYSVRLKEPGLTGSWKIFQGCQRPCKLGLPWPRKACTVFGTVVNHQVLLGANSVLSLDGQTLISFFWRSGEGESWSTSKIVHPSTWKLEGAKLSSCICLTLWDGPSRNPAKGFLGPCW